LYNLAQCYLKGVGCKGDVKIAHDLFLKSAEKGNKNALAKSREIDLLSY